MPAETKDARIKWCIALGIKRGETPRSYSPSAAKMADENSEETLREFCKSPSKEEQR